MAERLIATVMLWAMRGSMAWLIAHEYASFMSEKLEAVTRALSKL
jgi:hypothetical protein